MDKKLNLYNKHRPKCLNDFIGQETIKDLLIQTFKKNKNLQAFIFYGSHGIGKTSLARIFAKMHNCSDFSKKNDVCNKCKNCNLIEESKTMDIYEVDAASHSGVDNMREIIQNCHYVALDLNKKIYIIDEAHNLSTAAWNSLLKTIEEPPSENIVFLFLTTNINKIPETILSRCQKYGFSKFKKEELFTLIDKIAKEEDKTIDEDAKDLISSLSQGSARECVSLLELIFINTSNHINISDVERTFSLSNKQDLLNLVFHLFNKDLVKCNSLLDDFFVLNRNFLNFFSELLSIFMDLYLYEKTSNSSLLKKISIEEAQKFPSQNIDLLRMMEIIEQYTQRYEHSNDKLIWSKILLFNLWETIPNDSKVKPIEFEKKETKEEIVESPNPKIEVVETPKTVDVEVKPTPVIEKKEKREPGINIEIPEISKELEKKILYGLHSSNLNKLASLENYEHFSKFITSNKPSKELLNIFKKIKPIENQILTTDKTIIVYFLDEFDVIDFNELMKRENIQEELENFFFKKYEWIGITKQQLKHYLKVCKTKKLSDLPKTIFEKTEEINTFNEVVKILEES